jgi:hypothetical protein
MVAAAPGRAPATLSTRGPWQRTRCPAARRRRGRGQRPRTCRTPGRRRPCRPGSAQPAGGGCQDHVVYLPAPRGAPATRPTATASERRSSPAPARPTSPWRTTRWGGRTGSPSTTSTRPVVEAWAWPEAGHSCRPSPAGRSNNADVPLRMPLKGSADLRQRSGLRRAQGRHSIAEPSLDRGRRGPCGNVDESVHHGWIPTGSDGGVGPSSALRRASAVPMTVRLSSYVRWVRGGGRLQRHLTRRAGSPA